MRERVLLAIAALVAFAGCLAAPFVFDDFALLNDPTVTSKSGWWESWRIVQTRPLTWFTFWANYQAGGEHPAGYHVVNLALHVTVVILLYAVLRRLIDARAAVIAAAIFAVHPFAAEPVNYIFARGTLLATLFSLLALRAWGADRRLLATGWFVVAMLAKEECAAVPLFLLLFDVSKDRPKGLSYNAAMTCIAVALGLRVMWVLAYTPGAPAGAQAGISPGAYFAVQGVVILKYLRMFVVPWGFSVDYEVARSGEMLAWLGVAALAALASRKFRNLDAGFWFLGGLLLLAPSSSVFPAADLAADRRMYLPMIAFTACAGLLLARAPRIGIYAAIAALAGISLHYTSLWRNPRELWSEALRQAPEKVRPRVQLARTLPSDEALGILREGPDDPLIHSEQGRILLAAGRPAEALGEFGKALALEPNDPGSLNNRGAALLALGQSDAARADFQRALAQDPCWFDARLNLLRMGAPAAAARCRYTPRQQEQLRP